MIIQRAKEYAYGHRRDVDSTEQRTHYEKICQQWLINRINSDPDSRWYISDMEYTDGVLPKELRFGRFDLVAVGREKVSGHYPVALIELKLGSDAYSGGKTSGKDQAVKKKIAEAYEAMKKSLYTAPNTITIQTPADNRSDSKTDSKSGSKTATRTQTLGFGSGLVSHVADYLRYLYHRDKLYSARLKKEIIISIGSHKELGVLDQRILY